MPNGIPLRTGALPFGAMRSGVELRPMPARASAVSRVVQLCSTPTNGCKSPPRISYRTSLEIPPCSNLSLRQVPADPTRLQSLLHHPPCVSDPPLPPATMATLHSLEPSIYLLVDSVSRARGYSKDVDNVALFVNGISSTFMVRAREILSTFLALTIAV